MQDVDMSVEGFNGVFLRGVELELVVVQNGNEYYHQTLNYIPFYPTRTHHGHHHHINTIIRRHHQRISKLFVCTVTSTVMV